ncbi:hypothetical protein IAU60_002328 [Kwoniella sp. DSM 27419]
MKSLFRPFPTPLTHRQWFYLLVLQGVGAGIIDGGANFGVAYAMYHNQKKIKMWVLAENTLAGDLGVTPIIQCLASMLITSTLVHTDLHHHAVAPLPFVWPHVEHLPDPRVLVESFSRRGDKKGTRSLSNEKVHGQELGGSDLDHDRGQDEAGSLGEGSGFRYRLGMLTRFIFEGTEYNILAPVNRSTPLRILLTAAQGAALGIVFGLPLWLLFIVVLGPLYKHDNIAEVGWKWAPMVIKCVYGAVLGWITNPVIASLALGSQAEHHLLVVEDDAATSEVDVEANVGVTGRGGVETIQEDRELATASTPGPQPASSPRGASFHLASPGRPRTRSRASSSLSGRTRPPLTANCSALPVLPTNQGLGISSIDTGTRANRQASFSSTHSTSLAVPRTPRSAQLPSPGPTTLAPPLSPYVTQTGPSTPEGVAATAASPRTPPPTLRNLQRQGRGRGATFSTFVSIGGESSTAGTGSFSYALGGTGGRAQRRPRAVSSVSQSGIGSAIAPTPGLLLSRDAEAVRPMITPRLEVIRPSIDLREEDGSRHQSSGVTGTEAGDTQSSRSPSWDVFGRVEESAGRRSVGDGTQLKA